MGSSKHRGKRINLISISVLLIISGLIGLCVFTKAKEKADCLGNNKVQEEVYKKQVDDKFEMNEKVQGRVISEVKNLEVELENKRLAMLLDKLRNSDQIEVTYNDFNYFEEDYKPANITNKRHIQLILDLLGRGYKSKIDETDMSGNYVKNQPLIFYEKGKKLAEISINYDSLYNQGWVQYGEYSFQIDEKFFRLLKAFEEYKPRVNEISGDVEKLFGAYGYTPAFLMGGSEVKLPKTLEVKDIMDIENLYFALSLEMSKAIGLDYSMQGGESVFGKNVMVEIYYLVESLPESATPQLDARGIVIRYQGEIVGAHIDAGRHSGSMYTLSGKSFEEITELTSAIYLTQTVLKDFERGYSSDEELITNYFKAQVEGNPDTYFRTISTAKWLELLFVNMDNTKLFNEENIRQLMPSYYKQVRILEMKLSEENNKISSNKTRIYTVKYQIETQKDATLESGEYLRTIILVNEEGKWLVADEGF